jgi:hypothetical protein
MNRVQKLVLQLTRKGQLKPLTVVLKYRTFMFVEKKDDAAISNVYLFVCLLPLFNQSTLRAYIISVQREGDLIFCFVE